MYFDYLATTPLDPRVEKAMAPYWRDVFGNPHSLDHAYGLDAAKAVSDALHSLDALTAAYPAGGRWITTSGATEANNLALKGLAEQALYGPYSSSRRRILVSAIEHPCVLATAAYLAQRGFIVEHLPVTNDGALDLGVLDEKLSDDVLCVSVMWANNETGVIQPIGEIAERCRRHGVYFHSDAAQVVGKISLVTVNGFLPDFIALSAHKFYGPKGIGALYAAQDMVQRLFPQMHGGGQQDGLRSGTLPVPLVVGLGAAASCAVSDMTAEAARLQDLRDGFERALSGTFPDFTVNGKNAPRLPHVSHFQIPGVDMADLLQLVPDIAVARGSACSTEKNDVSHVLAAMRMEFFAHECLRVSLGRMTTRGDVEALTALLIDGATQLRARSSYQPFSAQKK